jgi:radical SAM superfamily enzyme YgiQ (UPF0313 family)
VQKTRERNRRVLEKERGAIIKPWAARLRIVLAFPGTYRVGMANLGFQTVYRLFNEFNDVVCERAFYPETHELSRHRKRGIPVLSLESSTPISEFDIIAFSMPFENDLLILLDMLSLSKIPLLASRRQKPSRKGFPLVMAGGTAVTLNPEPAAEFLDIAAIGEAEAIIPELVPRILKARRGSGERVRWLKALLDAPGIYLPRFYRVHYNQEGTIAGREALSGAPEKVHRAFPREMKGHPVRQVIFAPEIEFEDMGLIEISRGCGRACRFCAEGYLLRPPRHRPSREILDDIETVLEHRDKIGLVAPVVSDYPMLVKILDFIKARRAKVSVSSLRADALTDILLDALADSGHQTITLAPETGTERLRQVLNKPIPDREFLGATWRIGRAGFRKLKLYFLVGLPTETRMDIEEIPVLVRKILASLAMGSGKKRFGGEVHLSVNPFVPKPWTPFQWHPQESVKSLRENMGIIRDELRRNSEVKITVESPRQAEVQGLLSRGDRRVAPWLIRVLENQGNWARTIREENIPLDFYLYRPRYEDEILPWDFLDVGVKRKYLLEEYHRGLNRVLTQPCNPDKCRICGVC